MNKPPAILLWWMFSRSSAAGSFFLPRNRLLITLWRGWTRLKVASLGEALDGPPHVTEVVYLEIGQPELLKVYKLSDGKHMFALEDLYKVMGFFA